MPSIVATTDPTTGTILLSMDQVVGRDLFTRVVANGWGNMTTGQAWTTGGGAAADYAVNGTQGTVSVGAVNSTRRTTFNTGFVDQDLRMQVTIPVLALGNNIEPALMIRNTDSNNYYYVALEISTSASVTLKIKKRVLSVNMVVGTSSAVLPFTHVPGATYFIRAAVCGSTIMAKAWSTTQTEPAWLVIENDFDLSTGALAGQRSFLESGNTNVLPVVFTWDDMGAGISQPIRIFRVTPDGTRTELRGSPLSTEDVTSASTSGQAIAWDGEAPFDVDVFYEMTSDCSATVVATSNTVNLSSSGTGWLRDPVDPTRNFQIVLDASYDECLDQDIIVFSGLGSPTYANASGIFDIVDTARPNTVSMTRKNYASSLALTSFSLNDIIALEDIFAPGRILLLSLPTAYGWALRSLGTDYITCGDTQQSYIGNDQRVTARAWAIPFRLSGPPADPGPGGVGGNGIGGGDATYDALAASVIGTDYNTLTAAGFTYFQIASGTGY